MSYTARLVDAEGVTWDEFFIECAYPVLRVPLPPRRIKVETTEVTTSILPIVEFRFERLDGAGVRIYRLDAHVDSR